MQRTNSGWSVQVKTTDLVGWGHWWLSWLTSYLPNQIWTLHIRCHQRVPYFECLLLFTQGGLWEDQSCWTRPSCSRVAAEMWCQSEVPRFWSLASWLQWAANWASWEIQDPGDWRYWILHHVQRIWPPGSVLQCGEYYVLVLVWLVQDSLPFPSIWSCIFSSPYSYLNIKSASSVLF